MKAIKYFVYFVLFASMLPVVSSCGDDEEEEIVVVGRNNLFKQIIGTWRCMDSYIFFDDIQQEVMEMDVMWNKIIDLHRDKTYSSDFPDFGETGTFELGDNTITLKSDDGDTYTIDIVAENIEECMTWRFTTKSGLKFRLEMYRN